MEMKNESAPKVYENMAYGVVVGDPTVPQKTDNTVYRARKEEEEESWWCLILSCFLCR
jgi:hypothetical protein